MSPESSSPTRRSLGFWLTAILPVIGGALILSPVQTGAQHQHRQTTKRFTRSTATYTVPNVTLVDAAGGDVSLASALGDGPVVLQFIFTTCPTICPVMTATMSAAQHEITSRTDGVRMISISIDPEHDTPARLHAYAKRFKAGPQWRFLTGQRENIINVQKAFHTYTGNKMRHEPFTYLRASSKDPWLRVSGLMSSKDLVAELEREVPAPVVPHGIPEVTLVDATGAEVSLVSALNAGPVVLQFIYSSSTTICPVMSATMSAAQHKITSRANDVRMISISIDPEHDTPSRLRAYAKRFKAGPQWRFLTGQLEDIITVQKAFQVYPGNKMRLEPFTFFRASPEDSWVRLTGLTSASELVAEFQRVIAD